MPKGGRERNLLTDQVQFLDKGSSPSPFAIARVGNSLCAYDEEHGEKDLLATKAGAVVFKSDGGLVYDSSGNVLIKAQE